MLLDYLPLSKIETVSDAQFYEHTLIFHSPHGRCCIPFSERERPKPIIFKIPLDGSIMSIDQWITKDVGLFCGVDRSIDPTRLAGLNTYKSKYDPLMDMINMLYREGSKPDLIFEENKTYYHLMMSTWHWIVKGDKKVALICDYPGWNGKATLESS